MHLFLTINPGSPTIGLLILLAGEVTSLLISFLIPPIGIECRHIAEALIGVVWILSALLNRIPVYEFTGSDRAQFIFLLTKDFISTGATMGGIIATQVGVFNRCSCYTRWGRVGLALPQGIDVGNTLFSWIKTAYPAIAFLCVGFQLIIFPGIVMWQFRDAVRVFVQRDDGESNVYWLMWTKRPWRWLRRSGVASSTFLRRFCTWVEVRRIRRRVCREESGELNAEFLPLTQVESHDYTSGKDT